MTHQTPQSQKMRSRIVSCDDSRVCTICLSGIGDASTPSKSPAKRIVARLSACQHMFCEECILEWSKQTNTCPIDRIKFNLIELWDTRRDIKVDKIKVDDVIPMQLLAADDLTYCEICGSCDREDVLLLCDGCNRGYHTDCLRPRIEEIPLDVWYCRSCIPNLGRAQRWRELYDSSQETEFINLNPRMPEFTEITQAVSDNSSESAGRPRRRNRRRYIPPSSPSSSDEDSGSEIRINTRRLPPRRAVTRRSRKKRKRRIVYRNSDNYSQDSQSPDSAAVSTRPKRLCRMNSQRPTYQTRQSTKRLLRNNSLATSPSSSTNPEITHIRPHLSLRQPLSTQAVFTPESDSSDTSSNQVKNEDSSDEEPTLPDSDLSDNLEEASESDNKPVPHEPSPNQAPCSSHSDNKHSRSLRPRPRPANEKLQIYRSSSPPRKIAPRRAKLQAEQLLHKYASSGDSD